MKDFIFVAGAPGIGKSAIAKLLQEKLKTPMFEFGWIPEFRYTGEKEIPYVEEEGIAFENLTLVLKNYQKHGFKNVIVTDLEDKRIQMLHKIFEDADYVLVTLFTYDEVMLKERVLEGSRSSGYRDWQQAVNINKEILERELLQKEVRIDVTNKAIVVVLEEITALIN